MTRNCINKIDANEAAAAAAAAAASATINGSGSSIELMENPINQPYTALEIATTLCFTIGIVKLIMGLLKLGIFSVILSDQLVSAFSTGAAFHVVTSQMRAILGLTDVKSPSGPFKLIYVSLSRSSFSSSSSSSQLSSSPGEVLFLPFFTFQRQKIRAFFSFQYRFQCQTIIEPSSDNLRRRRMMPDDDNNEKVN